MTNTLSSGVRRRIDHYGFAQFVAGYAFDPASRLPGVSIFCGDLLFVLASERLLAFAYLNEGQVHRFSAAERTLHKRPATGELSPA